MKGGLTPFLREAAWLEGKRVRGYAVLIGIASLALLAVSWAKAQGPQGERLPRFLGRGQGGARRRAAGGLRPPLAGKGADRRRLHRLVRLRQSAAVPVRDRAVRRAFGAGRLDRLGRGDLRRVGVGGGQGFPAPVAAGAGLPRRADRRGPRAERFRHRGAAGRRGGVARPAAGDSPGRCSARWSSSRTSRCWCRSGSPPAAAGARSWRPG